MIPNCSDSTSWARGARRQVALFAAAAITQASGGRGLQVARRAFRGLANGLRPARGIAIATARAVRRACGTGTCEAQQAQVEEACIRVAGERVKR